MMSLKKERFIYEYIFGYIISFKLYHEEKGTEEIEQLIIKNGISKIFLSELSRVEFAATVWKRVRTRDLTIEDARTVVEEFNRNAFDYEFFAIGHLVISKAESLINKYSIEGLRTLDSIQLATAVSLKNEVNIFKTSDLLLEKLMIAEGLNIGN